MCIFLLDNTIVGRPNELDHCKRTEVVINTYEEILKTINFIDQRNQRQKQKYEDFIKDYVERIGKVGDELTANCKMLSFLFTLPFRSTIMLSIRIMMFDPLCLFYVHQNFKINIFQEVIVFFITPSRFIFFQVKQ